MNGLKTGVKSILWSAAALILLLAIAVPLLNALIVAVMMVPTVILYSTLSRRAFAVHMLAVLAAAAAIIGPAALIVGIFFLVPSIVMGYMYVKQAPARKVLTATVLTLLGLLLLELVMFDLLFHFSLIGELRKMITDTVNQLSADGLMPGGWTAELTESYIQTLIHSIPLALITISFLLAVITHAIARPVLKSMGVHVPRLQPAKDWMLPRIFVFYYLIVLLIDMVTPDNGNSFLTVALMNLVPLMRIAFSIQAIGFLFFVAHERKWNISVPLLLSVLIAFFPPLSLIGVIDAGFPIRKAFKKP